MTIGIIKEEDDECRVALTPDAVPVLLKMGFSAVWVERDAGLRAAFSNADYEKNGALIKSREEVLTQPDVLAGVHGFTVGKIASIPKGKVLISQFNALSNKDVVLALKQQGVSAFSLDVVPRTTRAQAMDVLSSMATVSGYKAVLLAATHLPSLFPMLMTAAGTIKPAKVLILGAGVAGLQAISTARRLGAMVEAFDVRAAAKEEVLSLGAKFVEVEGARDEKSAGGYAVEQTEEFKQRQAQLIHDHAAQSDVIICTAQIPGRRAPVLLRQATVEAMKAGAVIIDLAASTGGNCEATQNGKTIVHQGVTIVGNSNLPSTVPKDASMMFSKNILNFLKLIVVKGELTLNFQDDIVAASCIAHEGAIVSERVRGVFEIA